MSFHVHAVIISVKVKLEDWRIYLFWPILLFHIALNDHLLFLLTLPNGWQPLQFCVLRVHDISCIVVPLLWTHMNWKFCYMQILHIYLFLIWLEYSIPVGYHRVSTMLWVGWEVRRFGHTLPSQLATHWRTVDQSVCLPSKPLRMHPHGCVENEIHCRHDFDRGKFIFTFKNPLKRLAPIKKVFC